MADMVRVISLLLAENEVDAVLEAASELNPASWLDEDSRAARVDVFLDDNSDMFSVRRSFEDAVELALNGKREVVFREIAREDWANSWKQHFHVQKISERIVVKPGWESYSAAGDEIVLEIDPGMTFGTGLHGTTRGALILLDKLSRENPERRMLDIGCGSGILSIAAVLLGFAHVDAFDIDPDAVTVTSDNSHINGVSEKIRVECSALPVIPAGMHAEVVVVNILAVILLENAESIAGSVPYSSDARLILSGILEDQYPDVCNRFSELGFIECDNVLVDEWKSGVFKRGGIRRRIDSYKEMLCQLLTERYER